MKQSTGRLLGARLLSSQAALGLGMAVAVVAGIAACNGNSTNNCHNLPQAIGVIGQDNFITGTPNTGGVLGTSLGGVKGSVTVGTTTSGTATYVADSTNNRILGFTGVPTGFNNAAVFEIGQGTAAGTDFTDAIPGTCQPIATNCPTGSSLIQFSDPAKVFTDSNNQYLVVADSGNNRVLIWNNGGTGMEPSSNSYPDVVVGQPDFTSGVSNNGSGSTDPLTCAGGVGNTAGNPSQCNLNFPTSAYIAGNQLIVADSNNNRVLIWDPVPTANGTPATIELGQLNCSADTVGAQGFVIASPFVCSVPQIDQFSEANNEFTLAMNHPGDVWSDGSILLVADTQNNRILGWQGGIPNQNDELADGIIGNTAFGSVSQTGGSGSSGLHNPTGVTSDGTSVFVADSTNNRVLEFQTYIASLSLGPAANYVYGQEDFAHVTDDDPDQNNQPGDQRNNPPTLGITAGTYDDPLGVYANATLNVVYVTDTGNSRVLQYTETSGNPLGPTGVNGTDPQDTNFCF